MKTFQDVNGNGNSEKLIQMTAGNNFDSNGNFPPTARNVTKNTKPALHTNTLRELFFFARNFVGQQGS